MSYSSRTMRTADWNDLRHFTRDEFRYPDAMGYEFLLWLDKLRGAVGFPLRISSDHRPPPRNRAVGGSPTSAHMDVPCNAVDISAGSLTSQRRFRLVQVAMSLGCQRIGIYPEGHVHLDLGHATRPAPAIWTSV